MKRIIPFIWTILFPAAIFAQDNGSNDLATLGNWIKRQQINAGFAYNLKHVKSAISWWDAVAIGGKGVQVAHSSKADWLNFGLSISAIEHSHPRYGGIVPIHIGNLWNSLPNIPNVSVVQIPSITLAPVFLERSNLNKWNWKEDFELALAYTFGGS